ncbi:MAG: hypothetical protein U0Z44_10975 [Kouleothrix sp.]
MAASDPTALAARLATFLAASAGAPAEVTGLEQACRWRLAGHMVDRGYARRCAPRAVGMDLASTMNLGRAEPRARVRTSDAAVAGGVLAPQLALRNPDGAQRRWAQWLPDGLRGGRVDRATRCAGPTWRQRARTGRADGRTARASTRSTPPRWCSCRARRPGIGHRPATRSMQYACCWPRSSRYQPGARIRPALARAARPRHAPAQAWCMAIFGSATCWSGPDGLRAVIDWEFAHIGDPLEDLAWPCVRDWRFGNDALPVGNRLRRASASFLPRTKPHPAARSIVERCATGRSWHLVLGGYLP